MPGFNNGVCFAQNGFDFTGADGSTATNALGGSNSGITNTITCQNTSNTVNSQASFKAAVGGSASGDCWIEYNVGAISSWATGPDNSDSDKYKLNFNAAATVTPSTGTTYFQLDQTVPDAKFFTSGLGAQFAKIGGVTESNILNSDNSNASSASRFTVGIGGSSAGDAYTLYSTGTNSWEHGVDNSDTQSWNLLSQSTAATANLSGNINMKVTSAGEVTFPRTPSFNAVLNAAITNVTGDGTAYTVIFETEIYDQNADYNATNGIFTAPVTGRYNFATTVTLSGIAAGHTSATLYLVTSNRSYLLQSFNPIAVAAGGVATMSGSAYADMDAADTALIQVTVSGGALTVDINGTGANTFFGGMLAA